MNFVDIVIWILVAVTVFGFIWGYVDYNWGSFFDKAIVGFASALCIFFISAFVLFSGVGGEQS
jgi:hypothetical protein